MLERAASADIAEPRLRAAPVDVPYAITVAACVVAFISAVPTLLSTPASTRRTAIPVFVVGVCVLFGLGLSDLIRARDSRFARAVVAAGGLWSLSALAASSDPTLYSLGRVSYWLVNVAVVFLLLSYPSGRLTERIDRALFATALMVGLLYLSTALVVQQFPSPGLWSLCTSDCPSNAFALSHSTPGLVSGLVIPLREALTVALFLAVPVAVLQRRRNTGPLLSRMYLPIALIAVVQPVVFGVFFAVRHAAPTSTAVHVVMWINVLSLPAVGIACVAGRAYQGLFAGNALERLARELRTSATASQVSHAVADALEDPSLTVLYSFPGGNGGWVDESGAPVALAHARIGHGVTEVASGSWRIAIVHNPSLAEARALLQAAGSYALAALENEHLTGELRSSLEALTDSRGSYADATLENEHLTGELRSSLEALAESRARSVTAEDRERRKLERDLHDGAQQRLVALRVQLALAAVQLGDDDNPARAELIRALGEEIDATIDEVRSFARGVYPALLAQTGLGEALRAAGRASALPTTVRADGLGRYPPEIETTVYFSCSEALQNAAKHARGATMVTILLLGNRELHFEVRDDGAGFDVQTTPIGTGLSNLRDRLADVGGTMTIHSTPGKGTSIQGSIPLP
jgi:signal transduction histidine kinase